MSQTNSTPDADTSAAADAARLLAEACERTAVIELHRRDNTESIPAARGRMLFVRDGVLYLAEPQIIGRDTRLSGGLAVDAYFLAGDVMLHFTSEIISTTEMLRLNNRKRVRGYSIVAPETIAPGQRRAYFRTLVLGDQPIRARLAPVFSDEPLCSPVGGRPFEAVLVDGSPLGFGVNAAEEDARRLRLYDLFFLTFQIPTDPRARTLLVELRQNRDLGDTGLRRLGLLCHNWPSRREHTFNMQPILRWLNDVQRRRLRAA